MRRYTRNVTQKLANKFKLAAYLAEITAGAELINGTEGGGCSFT